MGSDDGDFGTFGGDGASGSFGGADRGFDGDRLEDLRQEYEAQLEAYELKVLELEAMLRDGGSGGAYENGGAFGTPVPPQMVYSGSTGNWTKELNLDIMWLEFTLPGLGMSVPMPTLEMLVRVGRNFSMQGWALQSKAALLFVVALADVVLFQLLLPDSPFCIFLVALCWAGLVRAVLARPQLGAARPVWLERVARFIVRCAPRPRLAPGFQQWLPYTHKLISFKLLFNFAMRAFVKIL